MSFSRLTNESTRMVLLKMLFETPDVVIDELKINNARRN